MLAENCTVTVEVVGTKTRCFGSQLRQYKAVDGPDVKLFKCVSGGNETDRVCEELSPSVAIRKLSLYRSGSEAC